MSGYAAFISYAHRYRDWVEVLQRNLERCLETAGRAQPVFLDQVDLGSGRSWVGQLQAGSERAEHFVLVATPEALASPRVVDEWENFVARRADWQGRLHVALLVDVPLPPFLDRVQHMDFREHDEEAYREGLQRLTAVLVGRSGRDLPDLPADIEIPASPASRLQPELRQRLVTWLAPLLDRRMFRIFVAGALGLEHRALEGYPSALSAASAAIVQATGDDDPLIAVRRIVSVLAEELQEEEDRTRLGELAELREALSAEELAAGESGLVGAWLRKVLVDHERVVPFFQQRAELDLLDRVYVQLELHSIERLAEPDTTTEVTVRLTRPYTIRELLDLDPAKKPWVTRRWVVIGDPGAGKTTLLRHLAGAVARMSPPPWLPLFESLPRLMREPEWLLDRIARQMKRAGEPAEGLPAVLDRAGQEGRLLVLLDGLDEVPREERREAEVLLSRLAARWPQTPIVVTSRPIGYRRPASDFIELELLPLDAGRRREYLARWFGRASGERDIERAEKAAAALERDPVLLELSGNPLYLTLMALLIEKGTSPDRHRPGLYDQVVRLLLDGNHRPAGEPIDAQEGVRQVLRQLAYFMTEDNRDSEPVVQLEARLYKPEFDPLRDILERVPRWRRSLRPFLEDLAERTGILGPHDGRGSDWRFWHRTFREALTAEALEEKLEKGGEAAILDHARRIAGDESRWAEPYALLVGRIADPDTLVRSLLEVNRALGLRALATAQGLRSETVYETLELPAERSRWRERARIYERIPELVGDPERTLVLLDQLRRRTRNGNDIFFLESAVVAAGQKGSAAAGRAAQLLERFFDHIPPPPEELFRWVETPRDGRVELWQEIPAGTIRLGSHEGEGHHREHPSFEVEIKRPFRMGAALVTNAQYAAFDPSHNPYAWTGIPAEELPRHPVVGVTWFEATAFCRWLASSLPFLRGARLPSEEEWEYACRAGTETRYWSGDGDEELTRIAWVAEDLESGTTHRVGEKPANPWGLYDVHGNVWEWTSSPWTQDYFGREAGIEIDPTTMELADLAADSDVALEERRVSRGGCCWDDAGWARAACRLRADPRSGLRDQGFRIVVPYVSTSRDSGVCQGSGTEFLSQHVEQPDSLD